MDIKQALSVFFAALSLAACGSVRTWGTARSSETSLAGTADHTQVIARDGHVWVVGDDLDVRRVGRDGTAVVAHAPGMPVAIVDDAHMWSATADGVAVRGADGAWRPTSLRELVPSDDTLEPGRFVVAEIALLSANDGYALVHTEPRAADGGRRFLEYLCRGDGAHFACEDLAPIAEGYRSLAVTADAVWLHGDGDILRRAHGERDFVSMGAGTLIANAGVVIRLLDGQPAARWNGSAFVALPSGLRGIPFPVDAHTTYGYLGELTFTDSRPFAAIDSVRAEITVADDAGVRELGGVELRSPSGAADRMFVPVDSAQALFCIDTQCFAAGE